MGGQSSCCGGIIGHPSSSSGYGGKQVNGPSSSIDGVASGSTGSSGMGVVRCSSACGCGVLHHAMGMFFSAGVWCQSPCVAAPLFAPLRQSVFEQAKADHPEKGDNEGGDACEGHLSPEAAGECAILKVGVGVKGDSGHDARAQNAGQVAIGSFHALVGDLVAHDAHQVHQ